MLAESLVKLDPGALPGERDQSETQLQKILAIVRKHLKMDAAFLSEFTGGRRYFRFVDAEPDSVVKVGGSDPLEDSYCQRVVDGRLPELMQDAGQNAEALTLPVTRALPVGAHISVPIRLADGRLYGTLCCFSAEPDFSLNARDLDVLKAFGAIASELIGISIQQREKQEEKRRRIVDAVVNAGFEPYYQPIYRVQDDQLVGFEALTRFKGQPYRTPDVWFREAAEVGMAIDLEYAAIHAALRGLRDLPPQTTLAINLSPEAVMSPKLDELLALMPLGRLILEITEHAAVADYGALNAVLGRYRANGLKLAADDAGAGYSCFRHVLDMRPDVIKLDMSLTRDIDKDPARAALAGALTIFGRSIDAEIVAEGVETVAELDAMRAIGVTKVQGYLLGKPQPLAIAKQTPMTAPLDLKSAGAAPHLVVVGSPGTTQRHQD
ncbi:MAG TPA: EAL domain-containing protein [Dongiaceae bacterium]|nr:EAL domain-containing protein [Dongiaceae bacterium]